MNPTEKLGHMQHLYFDVRLFQGVAFINEG